MTTATPAAGYDQGFVDLVDTFDALNKPRVDPETLGNAAGILMAAAGAVDDACSSLWDGLDSLTTGAMAGWQGEAATTFATSLTDHLASLRRTAAALESAGGRMLDAAGAARDLQIALLRAGDVFSNIGAAQGVSLDEGSWLFSSARDAVGHYLEVLGGCVQVWRTLADHVPALPPAPDHSVLGELGGLKDRAVGALSHPLDTEGNILAAEAAGTKDLVVGTFNSVRANPSSPLFVASLLRDPRGTIDNCFNQLRGSENLVLHPDLAIQAMLDTPDLERGDFGAWLGRLGPSVALSVGTDGLGAAEVDAGAIPSRVRAAAADRASSLSLGTADTWGSSATLGRHFADHGADFGASSADEYASQASKFLQRSQAEGLPTRIDRNGVIRTYDPATNEFAAFNANGTIRTYFRPDPAVHGYPTNWEYWLAQPGGEPWTR